jgi:uncharacterized protein (TIGR03067 family)
MRAVFGAAAAALLLVGSGFAADEGKLDGTYVLVGIEAGGEKIPEDFISKQPEAERTITIKGDKAISMKKGKEDIATLKIDASKKPGQITITSKKGDKDEVVVGIYKVEGDVLTICAVESEKDSDRPTEFKTSKDSKTMMLTLKKQKAK